MRARDLLRVGLISGLISGLLGSLGCGSDSETPPLAESSTGVISILGGNASAGFERVIAPRPLSFPADHGAHPAQQIEWWYTTANLLDEQGARFGIEVAFFRFGLDPTADPATRASDWATRDLYMAHFAVTDVSGKRFSSFERFTRGALGLAGALGEPWRVWNEDWSLEGLGASGTPFPLTLRASDRDDRGTIAIDLTLETNASPILHGDAGFSRKGPEVGNASHYYSYPSLRAEGTLSIGAKVHRVEGGAWFDHEWSTSVLGEGVAGWDWFALQFEDGARLMVYELRRRDGAGASYGAGTWIDPDRSTRSLETDSIEITVLDRWQSPSTEIEYPARWRIEIPSLALSVTLTPVLADQELRLSTRYWEGAIDFSGSRDDAPVNGWGYVELVGYGESP